MIRKSILALAATALLLTGCLVPEKFAAKASFQPEGSYSFSYVGTAVHGMAAMQLAKTGKLNPKDDAALEREVASMKRNPGVQSVSYKGNGRYELTLEAKRKKGQTLELLNIVNVRTGTDGVITISSTEINEKGKKDLSQLGIKVDGTLEVTIPKNAEVISHNATGTPTFFGLVGTYSMENRQCRASPNDEVPLEGIGPMHAHQPTCEERAHHVAQMRANFALEGMHPQAEDLDLQQRYIDGKISLDDMRQHAREFASRLTNPSGPSAG